MLILNLNATGSLILSRQANKLICVQISLLTSTVLVVEIVANSVIGCANIFGSWVVGWVQKRKVFTETQWGGVDGSRVNNVLHRIPPVPRLSFDVGITTTTALVKILGVVARESRAAVKKYVNQLLVAVHEFLRSRKWPLNLVVLESATDAILLFSIENNGEEVVVHELGQIKDQVLVVEVLNVENRLHIHLGLNVRHELNLPILNWVGSRDITERLRPLPPRSKQGRISQEAPRVIIVFEEAKGLATFHTRTACVAALNSGGASGINGITYQ